MEESERHVATRASKSHATHGAVCESSTNRVHRPRHRAPPSNTHKNLPTETRGSSSPDPDYQATIVKSVGTASDESTLRVTLSLIKSQTHDTWDMDTNLVQTIRMVLVEEKKTQFALLSLLPLTTAITKVTVRELSSSSEPRA